MKILLLGIVTTILISGCATKNAFSKLNMGVEQEKAIENTRCAKITSNDNVGGIFSAIYLNNIYKEIDKNTQKFYISIYLKNTDSEVDIRLNNQKPLQMKKLPSKNEYSHLLSTNNKWTKNYEVSFVKTQGQKLNLSIDSGPFSSGQLSYSIDLR